MSKFIRTALSVGLLTATAFAATAVAASPERLRTQAKKEQRLVRINYSWCDYIVQN